MAFIKAFREVYQITLRVLKIFLQEISQARWYSPNDKITNTLAYENNTHKHSYVYKRLQSPETTPKMEEYLQQKHQSAVKKFSIVNFYFSQLMVVKYERDERYSSTDVTGTFYPYYVISIFENFNLQRFSLQLNLGEC